MIIKRVNTIQNYFSEDLYLFNSGIKILPHFPTKLGVNDV